jgi:hypothetical protein
MHAMASAVVNARHRRQCPRKPRETPASRRIEAPQIQVGAPASGDQSSRPTESSASRRVGNADSSGKPDVFHVS